MGGSPCTHWSIAQSKNREVKAEGLGWELFKNFVIAKERYKPDLFLYENNWFASKEIKEQIQRELGCVLMRINSNLVSAQNRDRFYVFNWDVELPEDRNLVLRDIAAPEASKQNYCFTFRGQQIYGNLARKKYNLSKKKLYQKSNCLTTNCGGATSSGNTTILYDTGDVYLLTPTECERLQTMPDDYTKFSAVKATDKNMKAFKNKLKNGKAWIKKETSQIVYETSDTQRYKGLGNGWTKEIILHIMEKPLRDIDRTSPIKLISLYDGIGTAYQVLKDLGFRNVNCHAFEIDKHAMAIAMYNHPDTVQHGDAFQVRDTDFVLGD